MKETKRGNFMQVEEENYTFEDEKAAQPEEKQTRKRKTNAEKLSDLRERMSRKQAEINQLEQEIEWLEKSPEERREEKRRLDTKCKIIAGAVALRLYKDASREFTRENFENDVLEATDDALETGYFRKVFHA